LREGSFLAHKHKNTHMHKHTHTLKNITYMHKRDAKRKRAKSKDGATSNEKAAVALGCGRSVAYSHWVAGISGVSHARLE
jgi:hypothetical protein